MAVSKRTRYEVLRRDNHTCRYCHAVDSPLTVDHVIPVTLGGSDDPSNLVACCKDCNAGKSSTSPAAALIEGVTADHRAHDIAMGNDRIPARAVMRYMGGILKNRLGELERATQQELAEEVDDDSDVDSYFEGRRAGYEDGFREGYQQGWGEAVTGRPNRYGDSEQQ